MPTRLLALSLLLVVLTGCSSSVKSAEEAAPPISQSLVTPTDTPLACPVTLPNGSTPPGERPSAGHHGTSTFWTVLWPDGKVLITPDHVQPDGSLEMKQGWWRLNKSTLTIEGRRLDAAAPPLRAHIPSGYRGGYFQASGLYFPTEGCWEVTGKAFNDSLTFVTLVVELPFERFWTAWLPKGMEYQGADIADLPKSLRLIYASATGDANEIILETTQGLQDRLISYPNSAAQQVIVNEQPGICMKGALDGQGQWQADADAGMLEWHDNGFSYRISHTGLKLSCEDLLRMAGASP